MRSTQRVVLAVVAACTLAGCGGSSTAPVARQFTVTAAAGKVVRLAANKGDTVSLKVSSTVADEIHIHGYDLHMKVAASGSVRFSFRASIDGNFVIELESRNEQIASLTVWA